MNNAGPSSIAVVDSGYSTHRDRLEYHLIVRQEPKQARMCGVGGKADRRPIDPPPIVQLRVIDPLAPPRPPNPGRSPSPGKKGKRKPRRDTGDDDADDRERHRAGSSTPPPQNPPSNPAYYRERASALDPDREDEDYRDARDNEYPHDAAGYAQSYLQNPYYFMFASLAKPHEDQELHWLKDGRTRCTTGSVVSSLYHLKDPQNNNEDAGFFVFPDLSVRTEGSYRLKLSLYEVVGNNVRHCKSIYSAPFYVYTAKKFPGMEESTPLSCALADQGIKIRIRKDIRVRKRPIAGPEMPTTAFGPTEPLGQGNDGMEVNEEHGRNKRDKSNERPSGDGGDRRRQRSPSKERDSSIDRRNNSSTPTAGGSETPRRAPKRSRVDDGSSSSLHAQTSTTSSIPPPGSALKASTGGSTSIPPSGDTASVSGGVPIGPAQPIPVPQQHPWPPVATDPNVGPAIPPPPGIAGGSQTQAPQPEATPAQTSGQSVIPPPPGAAVTGTLQTPQQSIQVSTPQIQQQQHQPQSSYGTVEPSSNANYGMYAPQPHTPSGYEHQQPQQQPQYQQPQQYSSAPGPVPTQYTVPGHGHMPPAPPAHPPHLPPLTHQHSGYAPPPPQTAPYGGQPQVNQAWGPPPPTSHPNQPQAPPPPRYDYAPAPVQGVPPPPPSQTSSHGPGGGYAPLPSHTAHQQVQQYPPQHQQVYQQPPQPYYEAYGQPQYPPQQLQPYQQPQYPYQHQPPLPHTQYQQGTQGTYPPAGPPPPGHYPHPSQLYQQNAPPATHYQYYDPQGYTGGNPPAPAPTSSAAGAHGTTAGNESSTPNRNLTGNENTPPPQTGPGSSATTKSSSLVPPSQQPAPPSTSTPNDGANGTNAGYNNGYYAPPPPQQYQQYPPQQQYYPPQQQQGLYHPPPPQHQQYPQQQRQQSYAPPPNPYPGAAVGYGSYAPQPQQQQPPPPHPSGPAQHPVQQQQPPPQHQQQQHPDPWGTPPVSTAYSGSNVNTGSWEGYGASQPHAGAATGAVSGNSGNGADRIQLAPLRPGAGLDGSSLPVIPLSGGGAVTSAGGAGAGSSGGQGQGYGVMQISRSSRDSSSVAGYGYGTQGHHSGAAMSSLRDERWGGGERGGEHGGRERDSHGRVGARDGTETERVGGVSERARERERSGSVGVRGKRNPLSIGNIISDE